MRKVNDLYLCSSWYQVFNFREERARARGYLLFSSMLESVVAGMATGVLYSG